MNYTKGTFVVVPNKHMLCGLDSISQCLYMWLCSFADEDGKCFPSRNLLSDLTNVSVKTIDRHLEKLEEIGVITKIVRKKPDGTNLSNIYQLMLIEWDGEKMKNVQVQWGGGRHKVARGASETTLGGVRNDTLTQSTITQPIELNSGTSPQVEFSLKKEIDKLMESNRRELRIIGWFIHEKGMKLDNKEQFNVTLRRHLRASKLLISFSVDQLKKAAYKADLQLGPNWTLETLYKLLTK